MKTLLTVLLFFTLAALLLPSGEAILRGGRDVIPHEKTERGADALYDFLERARKVPRYHKRNNSKLIQSSNSV